MIYSSPQGIEKYSALMVKEAPIFKKFFHLGEYGEKLT